MNYLNMGVSDTYCKYIPESLKRWFNDNSPIGVDWCFIYNLLVEVDGDEEKVKAFFWKVFSQQTYKTYGPTYPRN